MNRSLAFVATIFGLALASCGSSDDPRPWVVSSGEGGADSGAGGAGAGGTAGQGGSPSAGGKAGQGGAPGQGGSANGGSSTGGSAAGGSGAGGSSGGGPSANCVELDKCCEELGSSMYSGCKSVVQMNYDSTCQSTLDSYHTNGYCTGSAACSNLKACCPLLPPGQGWQDTCNQYVEVNNAPQCEYLLGVYQQDGYCN